MEGLAWPKPSVVHFSEAFVICAGSVLFRRDAEDTWQICILHNRTDQLFVLPKGRKDCGETTEEAAIRETHEETGYPCKLLPCTMMTRAPPPSINVVDEPRAIEGATEPFAVTFRDQNGTKVIWWYLTIVSGEKEEGTQTASENYLSEFITPGQAIQKLTFQEDRNLVHRALTLVQSCYPEGCVT
ncbi:NUDIX hydrolase domain-like protein [Scleroderma yunnanense]